MTYNTVLKKKSKMKHVMNTFLTKCTTRESNAIVIDADTLMSSKTLTEHGLAPENIVVLNSDKNVIKAAKKQGHKRSVEGVSTSVLPYLPGFYDLIYLDYCGTPVAKKYWNPHMDILWSADRLTDNGVVIVTFTTARIDNAVERANLMIPTSLTLVKEVTYCETSPMYTMILCKSNDVKRLRDEFNMIHTSVKRRGSKLDKLIGRKRKKETNRVKVIWGKDYRKSYKRYVGKAFYGTVLKKSKGNVTIQWEKKSDGVSAVPQEWVHDVDEMC